MDLVAGIDVGTQGVRCIASDLKGNIVAESRETITRSWLEGVFFEQDPEEWWDKTLACLRRLLYRLRQKNSNHASIKALAVDSTSGSVIPVDVKGRVLRRAIMYNDTRAKEEAFLINQFAKTFIENLGYKFGASFALSKVLWIKRNEPSIFEQTRFFIHPTDFINAKLTGEWGISDISNCLKMGYDLINNCWPEFIEKDLGIPLCKLPKVVPTGEVIGTVSKEVADELGLSPKTLVVAGATDGTAAFYASGAHGLGDLSSTLGTTLVLRGISKSLIRDPRGRIYCHRHPEGMWLPGGASNTGGECLQKLFPGEEYRAWDRKVSESVSLPTGIVFYPLMREGERLPFSCQEARSFKIGKENTQEELYAACLEGVGYVERFAIELLERLGVDKVKKIFASGSGAKSELWCRIRASISGLPLCVPASEEAAMGACVIASAQYWGGISKAVREMIRIEKVFEPDPALQEAYQEKYACFVEECEKRGYALD
ncbi:MAG: D-ribulokinase [Candidatus Atribacteria bacterium]|jgi:xylulokinase|uniref:FGGY family carbohydrate kinase n=1 Tax=Thermatribacter velox TaxID=3039681 RepID=A0ABZ2YFL2_9BACT|nr:D-ribulokinase [Candidatus Atribacteria bacterium]MDI3531065.1 D-ribulokinase [Candidatus Atribacteria bacterium]